MVLQTMWEFAVIANVYVKAELYLDPNHLHTVPTADSKMEKIQFFFYSSYYDM